MELLENNQYYNMPSSTVCNLAAEIINSGDRLRELKNLKHQINHSTEYEIMGRDCSRMVIMKNDRSELCVKINDITLPCNDKILTLLLIKACSQAVFSGRIEKDEVTFPLRELMDLGIYCTDQSARRGVTEAMKMIAGIEFIGKIHSTGKVSHSLNGSLFTGLNIKNEICHVQLNTEFNWKAITQYFTIIPRYYFRLSVRSSILLFTICCLARQNVTKIEENGCFNISLRTVQQKLLLPEETKNPKRDIWDVIDNTIDEIMTAQSKCGITDIIPAVCGIRSLETGYLKITVSGQAAETLAKRRRNQKQVSKKNTTVL